LIAGLIVAILVEDKSRISSTVHRANSLTTSSNRSTRRGLMP